jgi:pimeloyl-ACP methyl ester carboxylesterase
VSFVPLWFKKIKKINTITMKYLPILLLLLMACQPITETKTTKKSMLDFKYPYKTKFVDLSNDVKVAYIDEGKGDKTLIFIHGLGSYLPAWQKNIAVLKADYRCIAMDLPGYPKSSKGDDTYNMTFFAEVILEMIDELKLKNPVLIGHSMGGQIAMMAALKSPELLQSLILIDPAGIERFTPQEATILKSLVTQEAVKNTPTEQIKKNFDINFAAGVTPEDALFMYNDRLYMRDTELEYEHYCRMIPKCIAGMLDEPVFDNLKNIKMPTLLLFGEQDYLIPNKYFHVDLTTESVATTAQSQIINSQLFMVPNAGHFAMWDNSTAVNGHIQAFLKK